MEDQKRKKKIWKWVKFSLWVTLSLGLILIGIHSCVKTNAMEYDYTQENITWTYTPYQFLIEITNIDNYHNNGTEEDGYELTVTIDAATFDIMNKVLEYQRTQDITILTETITPTNTIYGIIQESQYWYFYESTILANNNEIDITGINELENPNTNGGTNFNNCLFLVKTNATNLQEYLNGTIEILEICNINNYINYQYNNQYWNGYNIAANSTNQEIFDSGKEEGYKNATQEYNYALNIQRENFDKAITSANAETQHWKDLYESGTTPWGSFKGLLGMIVTFPIQWFKEGLDVNIFGVNVGGLIVGVGIIIIILTIIGLIRGKGTKDE